MQKILIKIAPLSFTLFLFNNLADASQQAPEPGFHGHIITGAMFTSTDSNLSTKTETLLPSLSVEGDRETDVIPLLMGSIGYRTEAGTDYYLAAKKGVTLGVAYSFGSLGDAVLETTYKSGEVWADPFLLGTPRSETDVDKLGGQIAWGNIMRTGFGVNYTLSFVDVDNDLSGSQMSSLQRDGVTHEMGVDYTFFLGEKHRFMPNISYQAGDMDGESNSYDGIGLGVDYLFMFKPLAFKIGLACDQVEYDSIHPLFGVIREDDTYSINASITWQKPFGLDHYFATFHSGYFQTDSNITFYDSTDIRSGLSIGYRF